MGVLLTQEFEIMRGKIDEHEPTARPQDAAGLGERSFGIVQEVQHLVDDSGIGAIVGKGQIMDIGKPHIAMAEPGLVEADTRAFEHFPVRVDPDKPPGVLGGKL
jgi:hypothetical protein